MILNSNFSSKVENVIIWSKDLTNWFVRNQEWLSYYELTHFGCLHFEYSSLASNDVKVLGRMANEAYRYIEFAYVSKPERAVLAVQAMNKIYEENKHLLSENAKRLYAIHEIDEEKEYNESESFIRVLSKQKHNGTKNRRPGKGHRNH